MQKKCTLADFVNGKAIERRCAGSLRRTAHFAMNIRLSLEEIVERVPIPELTEKLPGDRLIEFYKKLGWDGEREIDPNKVKLHKDDLEKIYAQEIEHARSVYPDASPVEINLTVGMLWANKGPSGYGNTPGMVELYPGWKIEE